MDPDRIDTEEGEDETHTPSCCKHKLKNLSATAKKYNLLICMAVAISFALVEPRPGVFFGTQVNGVRPFAIFCVVLIFTLNGLKLKSRDVREAMKEWTALVYGLLAILFLTVVAGVLTIRGFDDVGAFPLTDFATGLKIFFASPTTINMGIVISEQAGGNGAVALLLSVSANLIGVFTVPAMLVWLADLDGLESSSGAVTLITRLLYSVFAPCIVGQIIRQRVTPVRDFVDSHKFPLSLMSSIALACLPWISVSRAQDEGTLSDITAGGVFSVLGFFVIIHTMFLVFNSVVSHLIGWSQPCRKSVVVMSSQKTFPVSATLISYLPEDVGDQGTMLIACILCQVSQLLYDSVLAAKWGSNTLDQAEKDSLEEEIQTDHGDSEPDKGVVNSDSTVEIVNIDSTVEIDEPSKLTSRLRKNVSVV
eukprot:m.343937 g.343937  ORF g.343937 m.343937 type:complete len:421 (-) comp23582_c0_seq1:73-1335(-)